MEKHHVDMEMVEKLKSMGTEDLRIATLFFKPEALKYDLTIDYVAMDIKNSKEKYLSSIGLKNFDMEKIEKSIEFLLVAPVFSMENTCFFPFFLPFLFNSGKIVLHLNHFLSSYQTKSI